MMAAPPLQGVNLGGRRFIEIEKVNAMTKNRSFQGLIFIVILGIGAAP
jgi:hypothetical protein